MTLCAGQYHKVLRMVGEQQPSWPDDSRRNHTTCLQRDLRIDPFEISINPIPIHLRLPSMLLWMENIAIRGRILAEAGAMLKQSVRPLYRNARLQLVRRVQAALRLT